MRYYLLSWDDRRTERYAEQLREAGYAVIDNYDENAVILSIGGDGTILYAAREFPEPTIFPIRTTGSAGEKTQIDEADLLAGVERLETGEPNDAYTIETHHRLGAFRDGQPLEGGFTALNEISLHHLSPVSAVEFAVRVEDGHRHYDFESVTGDGVLVATPFGSTGYYRSITRGAFTDGLGIAFNNVHAPVDLPDSLVVSDQGLVEVEIVETTHASNGVLTRDNDERLYELDQGEPITIRLSDDIVELLSLSAPTDRG